MSDSQTQIMHEIEVSSFDQLHTAFSRYRGDHQWYFRGHGSIGWLLIPKAGRPPLDTADDLSLFRSWKRRAIEYVDKLPDSDWDWLAIAQHHGLATRLLDWTINPLVAAFFAVFEDRDEPAAVYAHRSPEFFAPKDYRDLNDLNPGRVRRFRPTMFTPRLTRQGGCFTAHNPPTRALETHVPEGNKLERILIAKPYRRKLLLELSYYGVHSMSLFPDLTGLSQYLNWWTANRKDFSGDASFPDDIGGPTTV